MPYIEVVHIRNTRVSSVYVQLPYMRSFHICADTKVVHNLNLHIYVASIYAQLLYMHIYFIYVQLLYMQISPTLPL